MEKKPAVDSLHGDEKNAEYWHPRTYQERLDALEETRRNYCIAAGIDPEMRMSRTAYRFVELSKK